MEKEIKPINEYDDATCECREDDNCGCPFYDEEKIPPQKNNRKKETPKTKPSSKGK